MNTATTPRFPSVCWKIIFTDSEIITKKFSIISRLWFSLLNQPGCIFWGSYFSFLEKSHQRSNRKTADALGLRWNKEPAKLTGATGNERGFSREKSFFFAFALFSFKHMFISIKLICCYLFNIFIIQ